MSSQAYRTTPDHTLTRMPSSVPFIIGNELAERFSFYGMRTILTVFMTKYLMDSAGNPAFMGEEQAKGVYHLFTAGAYFFPILGAILADVYWGKYKTILLISLMYCVGHGMLALMDLGPHLGMWDMKPFLFIGLALIAIGAGGIKPCVSANVGDQFGRGNKHLLTQIFNWFYFSINLGAAMSSLLTPVLLAKVGPWAAFGLPGVLMGIATFLFWLGRRKFVHVPPAGWEAFKRESFGPDGRRALLNLAPLFLIFVPVFWAIFDQTGSAWVLQAESMDLKFMGVTWLESQVQAVNPILILTLIPFFTYLGYPLISKVFPLTPLRKIGIGFVLTALAFAISAWIDMRIASSAPGAATALWAALNDAGVSGSGTLREALEAANAAGWKIDQIQPHLADMPNIGWQFLAYIVLTSAEIMVSIVCLEFAYTQSPPKMKSLIMGVYFLGVSLGNFFVSGLNFVLDGLKDKETGRTPLDGANYYWFFAALMMVTTLIYVAWTKTYKGRTYIQGESPAADAVHAQAEAEAPEAR
ncbi:MAG: POT family MFS transporter [Phycisphaerales bacterium]|jgi:POT family proton-dependent oligopeptide transporter|nr:POT family MFS transporter [Phycisphaerales bacterium]